MDNVKLFQVEQIDGSFIEMVEIDRGNGEYTSMLKSTYNAQQVEHLTENLLKP
jgi:hypothetical protein